MRTSSRTARPSRGDSSRRARLLRAPRRPLLPSTRGPSPNTLRSRWCPPRRRPRRRTGWRRTNSHACSHPMGNARSRSVRARRRRRGRGGLRGQGAARRTSSSGAALRGSPSALPEARPVAPAVSIARPPSAVPDASGLERRACRRRGDVNRGAPFRRRRGAERGTLCERRQRGRPAVVPTPTADVRPSSTPPSPAMPPETDPTIPGCNPTFVIDTEGHKIFKPECFPGKAPPL